MVMKWLSGLISKRKSKSNSVLNTQRFKKEQRRKQLQSVLKKAGLLLLGIVITSLLLVAVQFIRYYVQPLEPFNEFGVDDQETWAGEYQLNIGLWLREEGRSTFRNAIFIVKPSNPSAHVLVFPEEISTRDPDQLSLQFSLPIDRYLVSKQTLTFSSSSNDVITEQGNRLFEDLLDL